MIKTNSSTDYENENIDLSGVKTTDIRTLTKKEIDKLNELLDEKQHLKRTKQIKKLRCGVYARKSQPDERDTSLDAQINFCKKFIDSVEMLEYKETYQEDNKSGMWDNRPEFQRMIEDVIKQQIDVVVCLDWDRFARKASDCEKYYTIITANHGFVITGNSELLIDSPNSLFVQTILWANTEYQARTSAERSLLTMLNRAENSKKYMSGAAPFGYQKNSLGELEIEVDESLIVNKIFNMILAGSTVSTIAKSFNELGYKTRKGNLFTKQHIEDIARNIIYTGTYIYNKKYGKKKKTSLLMKKYRTITKEDQYPGIVSKYDFDRVQSILDSRATTRNNDSGHIYLLSGLVKCSKCGKVLIGSSHRGGTQKTLRYYYECPGHNLKSCETKAINAEYIEKFIVDIVIDLVKTTDIKDELVVAAQEEAKYLKAILKKNENFINTSTNNLNNYLNKSMESNISTTLKKSLDKMIEDTAKVISEYQNKNEEIKQKIIALKSLENDCALTEEELLSNRPLARDFIKQFIKEIKYDNSDIEIIFS